MRTRLGKTGVSLGQTVLRFGSRPFERRFNSDARVFSRFVQAFVNSLGADVPHGPHFPLARCIFAAGLECGVEAPCKRDRPFRQLHLVCPARPQRRRRSVLGARETLPPLA